MSLATAAQIAQVSIAGCIFIGLIALLVIAFLIYRQLRTLNEKAHTILGEAETVLATVKETAVTVGNRAEKVSGDVAQKAERIAQLSEQVAERVALRVDTTSAIVQDAISSPAINLASVRAGVGKGLAVWQELSKTRGGNGK